MNSRLIHARANISVPTCSTTLIQLWTIEAEMETAIWWPDPDSGFRSAWWAIWWRRLIMAARAFLRGFGIVYRTPNLIQDFGDLSWMIVAGLLQVSS